MWCNSVPVNLGYSEGLRVFLSHHAIHGSPKRPVVTNAVRQPKRRVIHGMMTGAIMAPRFAPELKMPVASERSLCGNRSATVLTADGKLPASPRPITKRARPKPTADRAKAWAMHAILH